MGKQIKEMKSIKPDLIIAANPIGTIGYYSEAHLIDMLGLTDRHIAKKGKRIIGGPGHERWDIEYVMSKDPDIIYPGNSILQADGSYRPSLGPHTSEEIYQRILSEYERVFIYDIGEYWLKKDFYSNNP
jgi:hypothetical protein